MNDQPTALRLADLIEGSISDLHREAVAAELRRLHAENESFRQIVADFPPIEAELQEVSDRAHRVEAQRDALLKALKYAEAGLADIGDADREPGDDLAWCEARAAEALPRVRAAIAKAEEA